MKRLVVLSVLFLTTALSAAEPLRVKGQVTAIVDEMPGKCNFILKTAKENLQVVIMDAPGPAPGDLIKATGTFALSDSRILSIPSFTVTGHRAPPAAMAATPAEIASGALDFRSVTLSGSVIDAFVDEIDNRWYYLVLRAEGNDVYVVMHGSVAPKTDIFRLVDSLVEIRGVVTSADSGRRRLLGPVVHVRSFDDIHVLTASPEDPFERPELTETDLARPKDLRGLGRRRVTGDVLATWNGDRFLLRRDDGNILMVELARTETAPAYGDRVQAVGFAETDFFRVNLSNARVRTIGRATAAPDVAEEVRPREILTDKSGKPRIWTEFFGKTIRIEGVVRSLPESVADNGRFYLACGRFLVPVDVSARPEALNALGVGARIAVTGVCLLETDNWRPSTPFPHIRGMAVVIRTPADVTVLSPAPWWTPARLLAALATLVALIIGFAVWNRLLQRTVERRSRQLLKSQIAKVSSDLRVDERTRLAVELHDSVAQILTGVSMQLDASMRARPEDPTSADGCLDTARRMLKSCLTELRRCIWDLRSEALEEPNFQEAVRKTVLPVLDGARLVLRLAVKRSRLSDATAHALLRVIRELAANGIRHGKAKTIRIAGALDGNRLLISVKDDGCGFDLAAAPGPGEGHFGLDGIRERLLPLGGTLSVVSAPGQGTVSKITLNAQ